jgi:hypothetical protein
MAGKQITDLGVADQLEEGDLMLIRKSGMGRDKSLSKAKLVESIGNPAVNGYTAISDVENRISLKASNAALVPAYCNGMKISFISPITSTAIVQVKIGLLTYTSLNKYSSEETVQLIKDEYVEAVFIDGIFKQTNNLNTHLVWSNEYIAKATIAPDASTTTYHLTSAIGVTKPNYYAGMSLLFTTPVDSEGIALVNVDGLGTKKLGESGGSLIAKDIYKDQAIMAIYNGDEFIKQKFSSIHRTPIIVEPIAERDEIAEELEAFAPPAIPEEIDIWSPDYTGNPDDPANVTSPNSLNSQGKPVFIKVLTVGGEPAMYKTISQAISELANDYGDDGAGHLFALEINETYAPLGGESIKGTLKNADLRWITLFSKDNKYITLTSPSFRFSSTCKYTPIFNFKISIKGGCYQSLFCSVSMAKTTFGKNTSIICTAKPDTRYQGHLIVGNFEAKYGIHIQTNTALFAGGGIINKGDIKFTKTLFNDYLVQSSGSLSIYNTVISVDPNNADYKGVFDFSNSSKVYLQNVSSTDRVGKKVGLRARGGKVLMNNCNFTSSKSAKGYDITLSKDYHQNANTEIVLQDTTGSTNILLNQKTGSGIIIQK